MIDAKGAAYSPLRRAEDETSGQDSQQWKASKNRALNKLGKRGIISARARKAIEAKDEMDKGTPRVGRGYPSIAT